MITRFKSTSSFAAAYANELRLFYSVAGLMVSLSVYGILQARILHDAPLTYTTPLIPDLPS